MKQYKLVISDLDGTLLNSDKVISPFNKEIIAKLSKNVQFGIATGRPYEAVLKKMEQEGILPFIDVIVATNGVDIIEPKTHKLTTTHLLNKSDFLKIVDLMKPVDVNFCVYGDGVCYTSRIDQAILRIEKQNFLKPHIITADQLPFNQLKKVVFTVDPHRMEIVKAHMNQLSQDKYHCFQSMPDMIEFVDKRVSKANGLGIYASSQGFGCEDVMVFGDTSNDIEMLQHCGWGVCMANGTSDALAIADDIALSNDQDGVGHYIKKAFFLE